MIDKAYIESVTNEFLVNYPDIFLVEVSIRPGNAIVIDVDSKEGVSLENCIALNKYIESKLDRDAEDFELEVGSCGITNPFKIKRQYEVNIGNEVEVLSKGGQKLSGILKDCDDQKFTITITKMEKPEGAKRKVAVEEDLSFGYDEVKYTKYLIRFK